MKKGYFHEIVFSRLALFIFLVVVFAVMGFAKQPNILGIVNSQSRAILPDGKIIMAEIADTTEKRVKGLSGRDSLDDNATMAFVFDKEGYYSFWMPDMNFAIDIVWLDDNYQIVDVAKNVEPIPDKSPGGLPRYVNDIPARYVLEFNAGFYEKHNLTTGDYIKLVG